MHASSLGQHDPAAIHCAVVYHKSRGDIFHVHYLVVFAGADTRALIPSIETDALENAQRAGIDAREVAVLSVGERVLTPEFDYRVDPDTRSLVESSRVTRSALVRRRRAAKDARSQRASPA